MPINIKLLFSPQDGRVLGAQAVGQKGVEKRIDVIAMAIQKKATVFDLEEAELCYAPQFGAAKDPVNMAGMIAANVLRGDVSLAQWEGLSLTDAQLTDAQLIDVRDKAPQTSRCHSFASVSARWHVIVRYGCIAAWDSVRIMHCASCCNTVSRPRICRAVSRHINSSGRERQVRLLPLANSATDLPKYSEPAAGVGITDDLEEIVRIVVVNAGLYDSQVPVDPLFDRRTGGIVFVKAEPERSLAAPANRRA
jgi:hypothetical protein